MDTSTLMDLLALLGVPSLVSLAVSLAVGIMVTAGTLWLHNRQAKQLERLKSQLSTGSHIYRTQFDQELEAYKEIWAKLIALRFAMLELRTQYYVSGALQTKAPSLKVHIGKFLDSHNAFGKTMDERKPFYSPKVHDALVATSQMILYEAVELSHDQARDPVEQLESILQNYKAINDSIEQVADQIRVRLSSVIPVE